jgi:hypothetical protein
MVDRVETVVAIEAIRASLTKADNAFEELKYSSPDSAIASYHQEIVEYFIERAFIQILVLLDTLNLSRTYEQVHNIYHQAKEKGFSKEVAVADEPYLISAEVLRDYIAAIEASCGLYPFVPVTKDLVTILRATQYTITDRKLFGNPPSNESDVHARIEGVLRCVFQDLRHKPQLTKPIKNFEPDTGLPSVRTLIEYKFVSSEQDAKSVADEILADTRGYVSKDWDTFLYVIYETHRVKPEVEWRQLLRECEVGNNTDVIVISGEPPKLERLETL